MKDIISVSYNIILIILILNTIISSRCATRSTTLSVKPSKTRSVKSGQYHFNLFNDADDDYKWK